MTVFKNILSKRLEFRKLKKIYFSDSMVKDLKTLLNPVDFSHLDAFIYIPNLVYHRSKMLKKDKTDYINLSAVALQRVLGTKSTQITDFLIKNGFIECYRKYVRGLQCRGYRLGAKYKNDYFSQKTTYLCVKEQVLKDENHKYLKANIEKIELNEEKATELVAQSGKTEEKKVKSWDAIDRMYNQEYYFGVGRKSGRVFSNLSNLPREARKCLSVNGKELKEIDIASSQPLLLGSLYDDKKSEEYKKYKHITEEIDFYDHLKAKIYPKRNKSERARIKVRFYRFLFGEKRNKMNNLYHKFFEAEFPELYRKMQETKSENYTNMAVTLQKREADAIIGNVTNYARKKNLFIVTIHDSIMTTEENVKELGDQMVLAFQKLYGLTPKLKFN